MNLVEIIESFSIHRNLLEVEKCLELLQSYFELANKYKNYVHFNKISIDGIQTKKIKRLYYRIKFKKSLYEHDLVELENSFQGLYDSYFNTSYNLDDDLWIEVSSLLEEIPNTPYEIKSLQVEVSIILEVLTSFKYKIAIPAQRKVHQIVELVLISRSQERVLATLSKYFRLLDDKELEKAFYNAIPKARNKKFSDNFFKELKDYQIKRDIRVDVLLSDFERSRNDKKEEKEQIKIDRFESYSEVFGTLVESMLIKKPDVINMYIGQGDYNKALYNLEKEYSGKDKDHNYYYLRMIIEKKSNGALAALIFAKNNGVLELSLHNKNLLSFVMKCKAEALLVRTK